MAILTAAQARDYLPGLTGTAEDTLLDTLIARCSAQIAQFLGYPPASGGSVPTVEQTTYTQTLDSPGGLELQLPIGPVSSVTSVHDDPERLYGASTLVAASDYEVDTIRGLIVLKSTSVHGLWSSSAPYRAIRVVYVAGWTSVSTNAPEMTDACALMVKQRLDYRHNLGRTSVSRQGVSEALAPQQMSDQVRQLLAPYIIRRGIGFTGA